MLSADLELAQVFDNRSKRFNGVIGRFKERYDYIVIDSTSQQALSDRVKLGAIGPRL